MPYKDLEKAKLYRRKYNKDYMSKWRNKNRDKVSTIENRRYNKRGPQTDYRKTWAKNNPDKIFASRLKKYDLTIDGFNALVQQQNGKCALCNNISDKLHIDHDHDYNEVRGLLCRNCNFGIGFLKDNISILENAIAYLSKLPKINEKWDRRFLKLAEEVSTYSYDPSTKVGAVITQGKRIISTGYNGLPRGVKDDPSRYNDRDLKLKLIMHAEENAIIEASLADRVQGSTLYVWPSFMLPPVCSHCCGIAIQAGVKEIVGYKIDENKLNDRQLRWKDSILLSRMMCEEAGVVIRGIEYLNSRGISE